MHETKDSRILPERKVFSCPVCGGNLGRQVPSVEGILENEFTFSEDVRIVNSVVLVARDFVHDRDEEGDFPLKIPHPLTAVIKVVFDSAGECTAFEILDVCINSPGDSVKVNDVKEVKI